jgi:hypothetical protein
MRVLGVVFACLLAAALAVEGPATAQTTACRSAAHVAPLCGSRDHHSHPIPSRIGGAPLTNGGCAEAMAKVMAAAHAYDDPYCQPVDVINEGTLGSGNLRYIGDALDYLLFHRQPTAREAGFRGSIFCDERSKEMLLAFPGTQSNPLYQQFYPDLETNVLNHSAQRPLQYEFALEAADQVKVRWASHEFDDTCGSGHPALVLTGHSKGGAEAQFSAVGLVLSAVVFNSDWVALASYFDMPLPKQKTQQQHEDIKCFPTGNARLREYYESGAIRDIRMVNDPLLDILLLHGCSYPHSRVEWLADTSTCSADPIDPHKIETVLRELQTCVAAIPTQK